MSTPLVLLAVDGSDHAERAAIMAVKMAGLMKARLLVLHCHRPFPVKVGEPYYQKAIDRIMQHSVELLAPYHSAFIDNKIDFDELILEGPPADKICEVARIEKCEMIIMGSRGRSDLKGLLLGSVTHRVLQQAPCPVLVVR